MKTLRTFEKILSEHDKKVIEIFGTFGKGNLI